MKDRLNTPAYKLFSKCMALATAMLFLPASSQAASRVPGFIPVEMSMTVFMIICFILTISVVMFFIFQRRFNTASHELKDVTAELGATRQRLVETGKELEQSQQELKATTNRYQGILFDAQVGMFQMDLDGTCSYINSALQELSGLYPKKALKEGLQIAIHPDDRDRFNEAWAEFIEGEGTFNHLFRFRQKGREVHVACRAGKVKNDKGEVESYIGWVSDVSRFHDEQLAIEAVTNRYRHFVAETVEGYYQLVPESPIATGSTTAKTTEAIMGKMVIAACNDTFAAMYGATPEELMGKTIGELKGGCGPFANAESLKAFVESGFKSVDAESVRQDPSGKRINLLNNVVGLVEDDKLVGIWGSQRNISQQKREKAELTSQVQFMQRILNALPADVHVKDTRCRYLYASKKLADRTGIPQEDWIGKTIFEVMPATPREHDQTAIETMKSGKLARTERPYEARGKTGWIETIQIPLVSEAGLVEGVVGLSLETTERKKQEEKVVRHAQDCEDRLKQRTEELRHSQNEHSKTSTSLTQALQKLKIAEAEMANREQEFKTYLDERKRTEETLRRSEQNLLAQQQQLEDQLAKRMAELDAETDKRKKWEELLAIKEDELRKIEHHADELERRLEQETTRCKQAETNLETSQTSLERYRKEIDELTAGREQEIGAINAEHEKRFTSEKTGREKAEKTLVKTEEQLQQTQEQLKHLTEKHAAELEREVAERKESAEKLIQSMEELDELKQQFSQRIEEETKSIKQELARKQIKEKALRQHEKDLEGRIKELEKMLELKAKDFAEQIQAREGAEVERQQVEQKLEQLTRRQQELVARETQKLNLNIAEIRLEEVKLRKHAGDLQQEKEALEEQLATRDRELNNAREEKGRIEADLTEAKASLKQVSDDHSQLVSKETEQLQQQLEQLRKSEEGLLGTIGELEQEKKSLEGSLDDRSNELVKAATEYRKLVDSYKELQAKLKQATEDADSLVAKQTDALKTELNELRKVEQNLNSTEAELNKRVADQQEKINTLHENLKAETDKRKQAEKELAELQTAFNASQENSASLVEEHTKQLSQQVEQHKANETKLSRELESLKESSKRQHDMLATLKLEREQAEQMAAKAKELVEQAKQEHDAELQQALAEVQEISRTNNNVVDELNNTVQRTLNPVLKSGLIMEQADNLSDEQKETLISTNNTCRKLIDMMNYRSELSRMADGSGKLEARKFDLHELISGLDLQFCHRAETKKLFFAVSFAQYQSAHNVPKMVETDENKLQKTLSILLGYGLEQTDKGRIGLHATRVSNEGEAASRIAFELTFTPRNQKDELLSAIFGADGAEGTVDMEHGLTLARQYLRLLEGTATLEYRDAGVTALTVELPFKREASEITMPDSKSAGAA